MPRGVNRSAFNGTRTTSSRSSVMMRVLAVMPGSRAKSALSTLTTTSYVTTFCTVIGASRTWETVPQNVLPGNASTVKDAFCPTLAFPTSVSLTLVSTCIFVRSCAIRKSVGVWKLAATV
jgi:hypothetical protein